MLHSWMEKHRGTSGLFGRIVRRLDVLWLKREVRRIKRAITEPSRANVG